jgi:hypothetical protein
MGVKNVISREIQPLKMIPLEFEAGPHQISFRPLGVRRSENKIGSEWKKGSLFGKIFS